MLLVAICIGQAHAFAFSSGQITEVGITKTLAGDITAVQQDHKGFLWIGTEQGVFRFDGNTFMRASELDAAFAWFDHVPVKNLLMDTRGRIWMISDEGVVVYDGTVREMYTVEQLASLHITAFHEGNVDRLWIGAGETLFSFDVARNELDPCAIPAQLGAITALFKDNQGHLWIGTKAGLHMLNTGTQDFIDWNAFEYSQLDIEVSFITQDETGTIWVGTAGDGLLKVTSNGSRLSSPTFQIEQVHGVPDANLTRVAIDNQGYFLIGTGEKGVFTWDPALQKITHPPGLHATGNHETMYPGPAISALFQDRTGILWVGTAQGLFKGAARPILPIDNAEARIIRQLELTQIKSFAHDAYGNLWIGTFGQGLHRINLENGDYNQFVHDPDNPNSLIDDRVISISVDRSQNVWIASHNGLSRYDIQNGTFTSYLGAGTSTHIIFRDVFISSRNEILIATENEGVLQYNPLNDQFERWEAIVDEERGGNVFGVRHIIEDQNGLLWLAAGLDGLIRINQDESVIRAINNGPAALQVIRGHEVISIARGGEGDIWAGTLNGGVFRVALDNEDIVQLTREDGLPGNEVSCLVEDREGYIWAASRDGLGRIDPISNKIVRFNRHDGLNYTQVHYNACFRKDTKVYIGTGEGAIVIDTDKLVIDEQGPKIELVEFRVDNKPVSFSDKSQVFTLRPDQNYLGFRFMIPNFLSPDENQLVYKLDGFEDEWKKAGPGNVVSLPELDPGNYNLLVQAANHNGVWGEPDVYKVNIASFVQPQWLNGALIISGFLLVLGLMLKMHYKHKKQILALSKEYKALRDDSDQSGDDIRSQIARDLHDDLGADLSRLVVSLENRLQRDDLSDFSRAWTRECWDYAQRITREVRHLSWAVDPDRNWLPDLVDRIYREAYDTMELDRVDFRTSKIPRIFLPPAMRKDIFLIFREALTNISTHASAEKIRIYVNYREDLLELFIEDNGIGFDPGEINAGNGLKNMKRRAQNLNARLTWENVPEGGTMVVLEVPLK